MNKSGPANLPRSTDVVHVFNPYLHGARGLFASMIVVFHVVNSRLPTYPVLSHGWPLFFARSLEHGVELFFGISGIVIFGALERAKSPLLFATERATRIYPVLWVTILTITILAGLTGFEGRGIPPPLALVANFLALPPLIPGPLIHPAAWSLSYELAFYFFCAAAWALRRRIGWWAAVVIVPAAVTLVMLHIRVLLMPVGMGVALLLARAPALAKLSLSPGLALLAFLIIWELVCQAGNEDLINANLSTLSHGFTPLLILLATAAAILSFSGILKGQGFFCLVLNSRPLQFLGTVSYSLYLWHPILMSMIKHLMYKLSLPAHLGASSQLAFLVFSLPPSLLLAWGSQRILEKRVTTWLRRRLEHMLGQTNVRAPVTAR
ncbi:MAG: acyltransferase family protein [Caulobacteraceae bacterium]